MNSETIEKVSSRFSFPGFVMASQSSVQIYKESLDGDSYNMIELKFNEIDTGNIQCNIAFESGTKLI